MRLSRAEIRPSMEVRAEAMRRCSGRGGRGSLRDFIELTKHEIEMKKDMV